MLQAGVRGRGGGGVATGGPQPGGSGGGRAHPGPPPLGGPVLTPGGPQPVPTGPCGRDHRSPAAQRQDSQVRLW
jgi:hypothetical protein